MARIATDVIDKLKTEVSLLALVQSQGYQPKKQGKDYVISCPFHEEATPSLLITPAKNLFNCFGCDAAGTVIDWVMKTQGISFRHAVELLQKDYPSLVANAVDSVPAKHSTQRKLETLPLDQESQALLNQVVDFYHETLLQSPDALAYLDKRGLGDRALIEQFKLGFANRTLAYRLPQKQYKAGKQLRGQLQQIGLLRGSGHEHFNGSLVVPVLNDAGDVVEVYGRKILDNLRKGTPKHLYLPNAHAGVWNGLGLENQQEIILCEALLDAMTFWVHGFTNVTASYGTGGFTDEHLTLFKQLGIKRVLIAYDRDEGGNNAAVALAKKLAKDNIDCYRLHFPKGMDANQYALEVQPAAKSLGVVIRSAQFMGEGEPCHAPTVAIDNETPEAKSTPVDEKAASSLAAEPAPPTTTETASVEVSPPLPASAVAPAPENPTEPEVSGHEINISYENRKYRVRGLQKNSSYEVLKVNVLVEIEGVVHVDSFDLYSAKHRQAFAKVAGGECGIEAKLVQRDLGQLLLQLESLQDQAIQEALKPKEPTAYTMDEAERKAALRLLNDPKLSDRIISDFGKTGLVGEPSNALMGYLACVSRKLSSPLAIIVQSTSAAGKSALMDAVLKLVPEEDKVQYSAMTGQSLFYLGETNIKHKILGIAEEEGVRQAAYALKLLQSQGELTMASTGKDPQTGKLVTEEYKVEGPVMLFLTTTAIDIDEELLNRCVVLTINESREQTAAIQQRQRKARTLQGLLTNNESDALIKQHQNAQRLLRPLAVVNPYAEQLAFADSRTRTRRDHEKYLTLIESISLLHQYQRDIKTINHNNEAIEYIETTLDDIALANQLAHEILGRSLDELPPPTRSLLQSLHTLVATKIEAGGLQQNEVRFTRKDIREEAGLSNSQVSIHLDRLVELEYVYAHHGRNGQRYLYELVFDGDVIQDQSQLIGLIDVSQLKAQQLQENQENTTTVGRLPVESTDLPDSFQPASGDLPASFHRVENSTYPSNGKALAEADSLTPQNTPNRVIKTPASYRSPSSLVAATSLAASAEQ